MNKISEILKQSINDLEDAVSPEEIDKIRIKYLGKKGVFTSELKKLAEIPKEKRPAFGQKN